MNITIGYLYGDLMNIYGDNGNIITLKKRLEWRGVDVEVRNISLNETIKKGEIDLYFFGGGQDLSQVKVSEDIQNKADVIKSDVERGVPLLSICGGYQLLGDYYKPHKGPKLEGIGLFQAYTDASNDRMIGNIVVEVNSELASQLISDSAKQESHVNDSQIRQSAESLTLVGFENHSGKTFLKKGATPLGRVISGFGNNGADSQEGCIYKNAFGCYMHGSVLPKNPKLADWLIKKALETKYKKEVQLEELDDSLENKTHSSTISAFTK
jgi:CobQ-like glutamine amidotransferase family enzyme